MFLLDLLEICDRATSEQIVAAEKHLADVEKDSDFEEDLAAVTGKEISKKKDKKKKDTQKDENSDIDMESDDEMISDDNESNDSNEESEDNENFNDDESNDDAESNDDDDKDYSEDDVKEGAIEKSKSKLKCTEKVIPENELNKVFSDDEISHLSRDEDISSFSDDDGDIGEENDGANIETKEKPDVWEDIYGRNRDKDGNIIKVIVIYLLKYYIIFLFI